MSNKLLYNKVQDVQEVRNKATQIELYAKLVPQGYSKQKNFKYVYLISSIKGIQDMNSVAYF